MCGIAGVYSFEREAPVDREVVRRQTDTLLHRGPDGGGVWVSNGVGLGHRRLAIIDVAGGPQPMADATGRYVVTFNGEIYNYRELRAELVQAGVKFRTESDTEVLVNAYAVWGKGMLDRLNGMFAFAIYDRHEHSLLLGRDPIGKKPLYYYLGDNELVFGSELKAVIAHPAVPREVDETAVADYCGLAYVPGPKSILKSVRKLEAGSAAFLSGGGCRLWRFFNLDFGGKSPRSLDEHAAELRDLLSDAVKLRLRSDVPLGGFLSGGIDSSAVVAMMCDQSEGRVLTQAVGFDVDGFDERKYARDVADHCGSEHHEEVLDAQAGATVLQLAHFFDEPFADSSAIPTYRLCETARKQVTVALSGDGGDELFAGYNHYVTSIWLRRARKKLPTWVRSLAHRPAHAALQLTRYHRKLYRKNLRFMQTTADADRSDYELLLAQPWRYRELVSPDLLERLSDYDPYTDYRERWQADAPEHPQLRFQYADVKTYLCDDILAKVDRASMAHSLEVRCPILDRRVIELAGRIPADQRLFGNPERGWLGKEVLRRAIDPLVPRKFFDREKQGFAIPLGRWLKTGMKDLVEDVLLGRDGDRSGYLHQMSIERMWLEHKKGWVDHGTLLYTGLMLELWHRRYGLGRDLPFDPPPRVKAAKPTVFYSDQDLENSGR